MNLDERKLKIIKTIIDDYIMTAVPVGSRTISKISDLNLSSATIRNEMSDLEEMGYLDQLHASSGRIPSDKAYRLYVDGLMKTTQLSEAEMKIIKDHFSKQILQVQEVITETATVLSDLTNYASIIMAPKLQQAKIKHVQLVPITTGKALVIIVASTGSVHDTLISVPSEFGAQELQKISEMLTNILKDGNVKDGARIIKDQFRYDSMHTKEFVDNTIAHIANKIQEVKSFVFLEGATKLFMHPEYSNFEKTKELLSILEEKETIYEILNKATQMEFTIRIGSENENEHMRKSSIVTATYKVGNLPIGSFGVIGPTRMNYAKVSAVFNYMRKSLTEIFSNMLIDDD